MSLWKFCFGCSGYHVCFGALEYRDVLRLEYRGKGFIVFSVLYFQVHVVTWTHAFPVT